MQFRADRWDRKEKNDFMELKEVADIRIMFFYSIIVLKIKIKLPQY
jgi:hypothetical protein